MRYAADYAGVILKSVEYSDRQEAGSEGDTNTAEPEEFPISDGPPWFQQAEKLEREDRLEDAEKLIRDSVPNIHCAITIADLYRRRWIRLKKRDPEKAAEARKQAVDWARTYASWATSGGEGAALSLARDEFLGTLGPEPFD